MYNNIRVRSYSAVDEYNGLSAGVPTPKEMAVLRKLSLLRDFGILRNRDNREEAIRGILMKCRDEYQMSQVLHDVLREIETLDELIARRRN